MVVNIIETSRLQADGPTIPAAIAAMFLMLAQVKRSSHRNREGTTIMFLSVNNSVSLNVLHFPLT